jgi:hypothetical protein
VSSITTAESDISTVSLLWRQVVQQPRHLSNCGSTSPEVFSSAPGVGITFEPDRNCWSSQQIQIHAKFDSRQQALVAGLGLDNRKASPIVGFNFMNFLAAAQGGLLSQTKRRSLEFGSV